MIIPSIDLKRHRLPLAAGGFFFVILLITAILWLMDSRGGSALSLAESEDREDRIKAADRLADKSGAAASKALSDLTRDKDRWVAIRAVRSLAKSPDRRNRDVLRRIASDRSRRGRVRGEAAAQMGRFKESASELTQVLAAEPDPEVRAGAAKGLAILRDQATIPQLVKALEDKDEEVRRWAITGIHKMIVRRFSFNAKAPPGTQQHEIDRLKTYLRRCGVLD